MKINYDLSQKFKDKHKHLFKHCYENSFDLLLKGKVDNVVIGFITSETDDLAVRHSWCIKGNEIIDSTFGNDEAYTKGVSYNEAFRVGIKDMPFIMKSCPTKDIIGYKPDEEKLVADKLVKEGKLIDRILESGVYTCSFLF